MQLRSASSVPGEYVHPQTARAAFLLERKRRRAEQARARQAAAQAKFNPDGVRLIGTGVRGPLSTRERALVVHNVGVRGMSQLEAGAVVGVSQKAVSRLLKRARAAEEGGAEGDAAGAALPATPQRNVKRRSGGRPSLLTPGKTAAVERAFKGDPFGGVGAVQKALHESGTTVNVRTLYNYMEQLDVDRRATSTYAEFNERLIHGLLNHIEAMRAALEAGNLTFDNFAYADQTPIFICTGHRSAYGTGVVFGDGGDAKQGKKVGNLWAVITSQGCCRAWVTDANGDEETTKQFFLAEKLPPGWINLHGPDGNIFDLLAAHGAQLPGRNRKMILCIDRLGKSGASAYPVAGHHAPELRVRARKAGVGLLMLPAKGAFVNPIELWNMHVKRVMDAMQPAGLPRDNWQQLIRGPRSRDDAFSMLRDAIIELNRDTELFRWCYHARAIGAHALQRLEGHAVAEAVRAARAAAPVAPFDVMQAAFAPRCRMSTDHPYPPSKCCAETYNVYFWRHHRLRLHAGLPPPFVRPVDAADGSERSCRLCKPNTTGARARDPQLVCCDSCPGVFHFECLGMDAVPAGAWKCASCKRGDVGPLRVWKDPQPRGASGT